MNVTDKLVNEIMNSKLNRLEFPCYGPSLVLKTPEELDEILRYNQTIRQHEQAYWVPRIVKWADWFTNQAIQR